MKFIKPVYAQIRPPVDIYTTPESGGSGLALLIANLWRTVILVGGMALFVYLIWGGVQWLMAGDDKGKVENARTRILNALTGIVILAASVAIVLLIEATLGLDLLSPVFTGPGGD